MRAAGGDHQRALGELLAANVAEVDLVGVQSREEMLDLRRRWPHLQLALDQPDRLGQARHAVDRHRLDDRRLAGVRRGHDSA
jgi:hypothetical protein